MPLLSFEKILKIIELICSILSGAIKSFNLQEKDCEEESA